MAKAASPTAGSRVAVRGDAGSALVRGGGRDRARLRPDAAARRSSSRSWRCSGLAGALGLGAGLPDRGRRAGARAPVAGDRRSRGAALLATTVARLGGAGASGAARPARRTRGRARAHRLARARGGAVGAALARAADPATRAALRGDSRRGRRWSSLIGLLQHLRLLPLPIPTISVPGSTFGNRNVAAEAVAMAIPFGLAWLALLAARRGRT